MSKSFKYVKEFEFPSHAGYTGSAGQQMVKGYARGGKVKACEGGMMKKADGGPVFEKATGERYPTRAAMRKHEAAESPREQRAEIANKMRNERAEMARVTRETRSERKDAGQEMKRVRREMQYDKNEMKAMKSGGAVKSSMKPGGMLKDNSALGIKNNKNPGETKMHTAPNLPGPKMAMKAGGAVPKKGAYKVGKVMGEFKSGELHSGSKSGPVVKNPKQAIAIALSEARNAAKKKK